MFLLRHISGARCLLQGKQESFSLCERLPAFEGRTDQQAESGQRGEQDNGDPHRNLLRGVPELERFPDEREHQEACNGFGEGGASSSWKAILVLFWGQVNSARFPPRDLPDELAYFLNVLLEVLRACGYESQKREAMIGCNVLNRMANTLRRAIEGFRFPWEDKSFSIGVSIGLVPITRDSGGLTDVLKEADAACYMAKAGKTARSGRGLRSGLLLGPTQTALESPRRGSCGALRTFSGDARSVHDLEHSPGSCSEAIRKWLEVLTA